jgi:hypothetical protein
MFHLIISESGDKSEVKFYDRLEAPNLVELFAKLLLTVARLQQQMAEEVERNRHHDDIPF